MQRDAMDVRVAEILQVFADADVDYIKRSLLETNNNVDLVVNRMLEFAYPRQGAGRIERADDVVDMDLTTLDDLESPPGLRHNFPNPTSSTLGPRPSYPTPLTSASIIPAAPTPAPVASNLVNQELLASITANLATALRNVTQNNPEFATALVSSYTPPPAPAIAATALQLTQPAAPKSTPTMTPTRIVPAAAAIPPVTPTLYAPKTPVAPPVVSANANTTPRSVSASNVASLYTPPSVASSASLPSISTPTSHANPASHAARPSSSSAGTFRPPPETIVLDEPAPTPVATKPSPATIDVGLVSVMEVFPDVDPAYVTGLLRDERLSVPAAIEKLIELKGKYPTVNNKKEPTEPKPKPVRAVRGKEYFYGTSSPDMGGDKAYAASCRQLLANEFSRVRVRDIDLVMLNCKHRYALSRKQLKETVSKLTPMKVPRHPVLVTIRISAEQADPNDLTSELSRFTSESDRELFEEIVFILQEDKQAQAVVDEELATKQLEKEAEESGAMFECGCCFTESIISQMAQCDDGHLFCRTCVKRYVEESVFGSSKTMLGCMASEGCEGTFPRSQLRQCLPEKLFEKFEARVQEESVRLAGLDNLVACPFCSYAEEIENPNDKVFVCKNKECGKHSCRLCKEESHLPLRCEEIEKKQVAQVRTTLEEEMSKALLRECYACKAKFFKEEGCNKMTCRCGATMCYVCRSPIKDYSHFCQCVRTPDMPCTKCTKCFLWSNAKQDDARAVAEIKQAAAAKLAAENPEAAAILAEKKLDQIGPKLEPIPPPAQVRPVPAAAPAAPIPVVPRVPAPIAVERPRVNAAQPAAADPNLVALRELLQRQMDQNDRHMELLRQRHAAPTIADTIAARAAAAAGIALRAIGGARVAAANGPVPMRQAAARAPQAHVPAPVPVPVPVRAAATGGTGGVQAMDAQATTTRTTKRGRPGARIARPEPVPQQPVRPLQPMQPMQAAVTARGTTTVTPAAPPVTNGHRTVANSAPRTGRVNPPPEKKQRTA